MMPSVFTHTRSADFTKPHFDFVGNNGGENQILSTQTFALAYRQRCSDEIAGMTWICFPINVVVIHGPNHVAIEKRRIDRIGLEPGDEHGGTAVAAAHRTIMLEQNPGVILLTAAQRATDRVEPK